MTATEPGQTFESSAVANGIGRLLQHLTSSLNQDASQDVLTQQSAAAPPPAAAAAATPATTPGTATVDTSGSTVDPVPEGTPVTQGYHGNEPGGHPGIDLGVPLNTTLLAAASGTVTHSSNDDPGGYGEWVEITTPNGDHIRYGHLHTASVNVGDSVKAGQPIGTSGGEQGGPTSGNSEGPHLHFEVRDAAGNTVDPTPWLAGGHQIVSAAPQDVTVQTPIPISPQSAADTGVSRATAFLSGQGDTGSENQQQTQTTTVPGSKQTAEQTTGSWAGDVLTGIGAPVTPENLRVMEAWAQAEGGATHNNWLNTTQDAPGATNFNSVGVKTYTSYQQGIQATIQTLLNGNYANIIAALKAGNSAKAVADAIASSPWGTGGLVQQIIGGG